MKKEEIKIPKELLDDKFYLSLLRLAVFEPSLQNNVREIIKILDDAKNNEKDE